MTALLSATQLSYWASPTKPLQSNLNFSVSAGELFLIEGPNGSGKSTLLKVLLGLHPVGSGKRVLSVSDTKIAYIPQLQNTEFHLPLTLEDILDISVPIYERKNALNIGLLSEEQLQLAWNTASGGERKRTLLTRALLNDCELLFLDEPMNHLDVESRHKMLNVIGNFVLDSTTKRAAIMVSHEGTAELSDNIPLNRLVLADPEKRS